MAKNIKVNALASILVRVFNILFPLITGPYLARVLSKDAYGEFNIANSILNLFIPFAAFGIYSYGIRSISRVKNNMKEISKNFTVLFSINVISSLGIGILYIGYMLLNVNSNMYMLYLALSIQIFTQFVTIEWMNEAFENYGFILFKTLFIRVLMLVSIFVLMVVVVALMLNSYDRAYENAHNHSSYSWTKETYPVEKYSNPIDEYNDNFELLFNLLVKRVVCIVRIGRLFFNISPRVWWPESLAGNHRTRLCTCK